MFNINEMGFFFKRLKSFTTQQLYLALLPTGPAKPAANSAKLKPSWRNITGGERRYFSGEFIFSQ